MDKCYIISRYRGKTNSEVEFNKRVARHFCRQVLIEDLNPIAPHIYYTQFLNDNNELDRDLGTALGITELREAKTFLLIMIDGVISEGMRRELVEVSRLGIPGRVVALTKREAMRLVDNES